MTREQAQQIKVEDRIQDNETKETFRVVDISAPRLMSGWIVVKMINKRGQFHYITRRTCHKYTRIGGRRTKNEN